MSWSLAKPHPKVTACRVMRAVESHWNSLDNPGFCIACGAEAEACDPDARNETCDACGARAVFGAEELMIAAVLR